MTAASTILDIGDWFLHASERDNPATEIDARHPGEQAWSTGNHVRPLIHGATYFAELVAAVRRMRAGDLLLFADWRGDPDERLTGDAGQRGGAGAVPRRRSAASTCAG